MVKWMALAGVLLVSLMVNVASAAPAADLQDISEDFLLPNSTESEEDGAFLAIPTAEIVEEHDATTPKSVVKDWIGKTLFNTIIKLNSVPTSSSKNGEKKVLRERIENSEDGNSFNISISEDYNVTAVDGSYPSDDEPAYQGFTPGKIFQFFKCFGIGIGVAMAVGLVVPIVLLIILQVVGFTLWGVAAASCAACCQSRIGDVPAGSCFSFLQRTGATFFYCSDAMMISYGILSIIGGILGGYFSWLYL